MDLMDRRRMMIAKKTLPYDAEVEYLKSTGTQYIDTRYTMESDVVEYGVEIYGANGNNTSIFGAESSTVPKYSGILYGVNQSLFIGSKAYVVNLNIPTNRWNTCIIQTSNSTNGKVIVNGTETSFTYSNGINKSLPIFLFANDKYGSAVQKTSLKLKHFWIKDNGTLVREFIPVRVGTTGYMYDKVSKQLLGNAGTGDFILGPDI